MAWGRMLLDLVSLSRGIIPRLLSQDDETAVSQMAFGGLAEPQR